MGERAVRVVVALEREQVGEQRAPLAARDADREQEHHLEIGDARGHDAEAVEPGVDQRRRNAGLLELAVLAHSRRKDAHLDRIEHAPVVGDVVEAVPVVAGAQDPRLLAAGEQLRRRVLERDLACRPGP